MIVSLFNFARKTITRVRLKADIARIRTILEEAAPGGYDVEEEKGLFRVGVMPAFPSLSVDCLCMAAAQIIPGAPDDSDEVDSLNLYLETALGYSPGVMEKVLLVLRDMNEKHGHRFQPQVDAFGGAYKAIMARVYGLEEPTRRLSATPGEPSCAVPQGQLAKEDRVRRAIDVMRKEGLFRRKYDYTWVMYAMNEVEGYKGSFTTPKQFLTYMAETLGIADMPSLSTLQKGNTEGMAAKGLGAVEADRRMNVRNRFISLYRKG